MACHEQDVSCARAEEKPRSSPGRRRRGKGAPEAAGRQCILKGKKRQSSWKSLHSRSLRPGPFIIPFALAGEDGQIHVQLAHVAGSA
eukprot:6079497-Pyramimonas_sp.AAC.1